MKTRINKKSYFLLAILTVFVFSSFISIGKATSYDFTFNIDELKETIQNSPLEAWKKPGENRKNTICNKLTKLQDLIEEEKFEEAYNKLLHDIKPKLTGLKQDEHGITWGNGVFNNPWVICGDLRAMFLNECDLILDQINPFSVYDDDKTPPEITIIYEGGYYLATLGVWHVIIEDIESGIDEVVIEINGVVYIDEQDLGGVLSLTYNNLPLPFAVDTHMISVNAINNDKDSEWDQELGTETDWIEILEDTTAPIIEIVYQGDNNDQNPGIWNVTAYDDESGINMASLEIFIDDQFVGNELDDYNVPNTPDMHSIYVGLENNDPINPLFSSLSGATTIIDDDITAPSILIQYIGDGNVLLPGIWHVEVEDLDSGLAEVEFLIGNEQVSYDQNIGGIQSKSYDITVPNLAGEFTLTVVAKNNDNDWNGDQEEDTGTSVVEILGDLNPPVIDMPEDIEYEYGSTGNTLVWVVSDEYPHSYEIFKDGESFESGVWESGVSITINIDGFAVGTYEFMIVCDDSYNNIATDTVLVNVIEDDDTTPPTIIIHYFGANMVNDPGIWIVVVEDVESGIGEIQCFSDGNLVLHEFFNGELLIDRDINVPGEVGIHNIEVIATNYDNEWENDQETSTKTRSVEIEAFIPPPPPIIPPADDDTEAPVIILIPASMEITDADAAGGVLVDWIITDASGISQASVFLNGAEISSYELANSISGSFLIPSVPGTYTIDVVARDNDNDPEHSGIDWLESSAQTVITIIDDDTEPPTILITYIGDYHTENAGVWNVVIEDIGAGLAEVIIIVDGIEILQDENLEGIYSKEYDIAVPVTEGTHIIEVMAKDNDNQWIGDPQEITISQWVIIDPPPLDPPDPPPIIG